MAYLGKVAGTRHTGTSKDSFSGDGSTTAFTMSSTVHLVTDVEVFVDNVQQEPTIAYTLSGTTLTFTEAPDNGTDNIYVIHRSGNNDSFTIQSGTSPSFNNITLKNDGNIGSAGDSDSIAINSSGRVTLSNNLTVNGTSTLTGGIVSPVTVNGSTPTLTIGDAGAEDAKIVFDGNAQDYHIGLDDSADTLVIGKGSALGTTTSMSFDANGIVTKPLQPAFLVRPASAQSNVAINATTTIVFGTEVYDQNADFSSNTFTAPVTGKYLLNVETRIDSMDLDTTYYDLKIVASNRTVENLQSMNQFDADPSYSHRGLTVVMDMDASDTAYVALEIHNSGAGQADISEFSHFSGYLLG